MPSVAAEIITGLGGLGIGAVALKLAQTWVEKRASVSPTSDAAELVSAAAEFQEAMNAAAKGVIGDLVLTVSRLEAKCLSLEAENERCRLEAEQLRQQSRSTEQRLDSLLRQLRDPASTQPGGSLSSAVIELSEGEVRVTHAPIFKEPNP